MALKGLAKILMALRELALYVGVAISCGVLFAPLTALYLRNIAISFYNVIAPILTE